MRKITALSIAFFLVSLAACGEDSEYRRFDSPDGNFHVLVIHQGTLGALLPGQSGDAPGIVQLIDKQGRVLEQTPVEMVQLVDNVRWHDERVDIRLIAVWNLPPTP